MEIFSSPMSRLLQIIFLSIIYISHANASSSVTFLEPGSSSRVLPEVGTFGYVVERMNVYCYIGREKELSSLLQSITLSIDIDSDDFNYFSGFTPKDVEIAYSSQKSIFSMNLLSRSKKKVMYLNPFNRTCIGLATAEEYQVSLNLIRLDLIKLALLVGGLFVFFTASTLSGNEAFYYLTGILLGNVASVLITVVFISKLFPRKPLMIGIIATGWTLAAYFAQILIENAELILMSYQKYVVYYVIATSCISFAVCYYFGPPKKQRSKNLIKWSLQLAGLTAIFFSSEFFEATIAIIASSIVLYYFPINFFGGLRRFLVRMWRKRFPPKRKLLTNEEFEEQGRIETEKALRELREYVKSPKCKEQWKLVMNLSEPTRFASFVEGDSHITNDETMNYDNTLHMDFSEDETDEDIIEESITVDQNFIPIDKTKLKKVQPDLRRMSFNRSAQVTSSTPNGRMRNRKKNGTTPAPNNSFEISDDE